MKFRWRWVVTLVVAALFGLSPDFVGVWDAAAYAGYADVGAQQTGFARPAGESAGSAPVNYANSSNSSSSRGPQGVQGADAELVRQVGRIVASVAAAGFDDAQRSGAR